MRRLFPILSSILIGALAVALGMGIYLRKANVDRELLSKQTVEAQQMVKDAQQKQDQAIREANTKLADANAEVTKAQLALLTFQEEQKAMLSAIQLQEPKPSALRGWKEAVDLALGVSLKYPQTSEIENADGSSLTVSTVALTSNLVPVSDRRWLSLMPWNDTKAQELTLNFTTSTPVSYAVRGHLISGNLGAIDGAVPNIFVLKVRTGNAEYLIWARDPDKLPDHQTLLRTLSTFSFND